MLTILDIQKRHNACRVAVVLGLVLLAAGVMGALANDYGTASVWCAVAGAGLMVGGIQAKKWLA